MIEEENSPDLCPISSEYGQWIHKEFCDRLPKELLWVEKPDTKEKIRVIPGVHRDGAVQIGRHIPPLQALKIVLPEKLCMDYLEKGY
jgi:hypothetical protein